jgi:predicted GNAT superfamily acetyltransferase
MDVRPLDRPEELRAAVDLYRAVLGLDAADPAVSPRLLASLRKNAGSVIGAFPGDRPDELIGFAYGFIGKDPETGEIYHYSQTAVVDDAWQGKGVGRALKQGQRAHVVETGVTRMRWSYDPVRASNGHFNLDVLGARGKWFVRNFYGIDDMGRDRGHASDRLIVEWDLVDEPCPGAVDWTPEPTPEWGAARPHPLGLVVGVPRHWRDVAADHERAVAVREAVSRAMETALSEGFVASSCRVADAGTAVYLLRRTGNDVPEGTEGVDG